MTLRYLVSYHDVNTPQPIRDVMGALICFTTLQPNGKFAAELTRAQWDLLRATRWTSLIQDIGFLIPDVDFKASDGKIFTTLDECAEHEAHTQRQKDATERTFAMFESSKLPELPKEVESREDEIVQEIVADREFGLREAHHIRETTNLAVLESRILTAVSQGSVHTKDLREQLEVSGEDIKAVVSASQFLVWKGPRVALASISTPS